MMITLEISISQNNSYIFGVLRDVNGALYDIRERSTYWTAETLFRHFDPKVDFNIVFCHYSNLAVGKTNRSKFINWFNRSVKKSYIIKAEQVTV